MPLLTHCLTYPEAVGVLVQALYKSRLFAISSLDDGQLPRLTSLCDAPLRQVGLTMRSLDPPMAVAPREGEQADEWHALAHSGTKATSTEQRSVADASRV